MQIPFVGPSYNLDARSFDVQRSINLYPVISETSNSKNQYSLRGTSGLELFGNAGDDAIRGGISSTSGRAFVVSGDKFVEIKAGGATEDHGTLSSLSGRVSIAENNTQIMVVDGFNGWIFTKSTDVWAQITDTDFPECETVTYQDGYFIVPEKGTQNVWISALSDGTSWGALDFTSVESSPDNLVNAISDRGNLWLFGNRSVEVYQNTGAATFPFQRIAGAIIQTGCAAAFSVQKFDNNIIWLGTDEQGQGVVWLTNGYNAVRVSTAAIEKRIAEAGAFSDAYAFTYHEQGHVFYCLQIPQTDTTLCYDAATKAWHERSYENPISNQKELHRGSVHIFFNGKNLIGDRENGNIYEMDLNFYSDAGDEIVRERVCPHIQEEKKLLTFSSFEIDMETGVGLVTGQGSDPQIMMQYSDDGGNTWSNELWRDIGGVGEYSTRVIWRRLGCARDRVFKVRISDPVFVQMNESYVNAT